MSLASVAVALLVFFRLWIYVFKKFPSSCGYYSLKFCSYLCFSLAATVFFLTPYLSVSSIRVTFSSWQRPPKAGGAVSPSQAWAHCAWPLLCPSVPSTLACTWPASRQLFSIDWLRLFSSEVRLWKGRRKKIVMLCIICRTLNLPEGIFFA